MQKQSPPARSLDKYMFQPRTRNFVVSSTGGGKSTLMAVLGEGYHRRHPTHPLWIIDPKRRFVPIERRAEIPWIFPDGARERNYGRRDGVAVVADIVLTPGKQSTDDTVHVIQDEPTAYALFDWLYENADVRHPSLILCDESFDFVKGHRSHESLRRLLQQGREMGVGLVIINQRPKWIDQTWLSEANNLYVGLLAHPDDREHISRAITSVAGARRALKMLPERVWMKCDQRRRTSRVFRLTEV